MFEEKSIRDTCRELAGDIGQGLSEREAKRRYQENGKNELKEKKKKSLAASFWEQINDPLIYVLLAAAAVSVFLKEFSDAVIIAAVVLMNSVVGMIQEGKARQALESLKKLTSPHACVLREGIRREIPAAELVVGDIVCLEAGCQVPADLRLLETENLKTEESALTGESMAVLKDSLFLSSREHTPLGDRRNMAYMSTIVTNGRGKGMVTAVGMDTEIGRIAALINAGNTEMTPLQKRLGELGKILSILSLLLCAGLFMIAVLQHRNIMEMLITAISLAVAAVPEGLPAVVTICLALSVTRMVKVNTIVRRLPCVETLGAVNIVCSDKTGTLTQNKMTVKKCFINQRILDATDVSQIRDGIFLEAMTLCNDAVLEERERMGDPTELALLELSFSHGLRRQRLEQEMPRIDELAFDSDRKMMSTLHKKGSSTVTYTKGAPDRILQKCGYLLTDGTVRRMSGEQRRQIQKSINEMSEEALRLIGAAKREGDSCPVERDMIFLGFAAMEDPVREEAAEAVRRFRQAGIHTVMITGDHVDTAFSIARKLGIVESHIQCMTGEEMEKLSGETLLQKLEGVRVFARVSPKQKVQIVKGLKEKGYVTAMTGDGVNDAPSLQEADVGIAMGKTGTDVARQAADMVLTDDNFATIEKAIEEGRGVYENIRKSVIFLLSSNLGEIMTMFAAVAAGLASPLKSAHILWINLITDSLPALALGVDENDGEELMRCSPRKPGESLFARGGLLCTCFYGFLIAAISLIAFSMLPFHILSERNLPFTIGNFGALMKHPEILRTAQTYTFTVLGMSQLFHAVGMRDTAKSVFQMNHGSNKLMILACIAGCLLQLAVTEVPFLIQMFGTTHLSLTEWGILSLLAAFPMLAHELFLVFDFDYIFSGEKQILERRNKNSESM